MRQLARIAALVASAACGATLASQSIRPAFPAFVDVADAMGVTLVNLSGKPAADYILEATGNGAGFFDYDNDGDIDVLAVNMHEPPSLYRNEGGTGITGLVFVSRACRATGMRSALVLKSTWPGEPG